MQHPVLLIKSCPWESFGKASFYLTQYYDKINLTAKNTDFLFYFHHCQLCKRWSTSLLQWKTDISYHESWHNHRWAIRSKVDFFHRSSLLLRGHPHSISSELNIGCRPLGGQAGWCHLSKLQVGRCRNGCWDGYQLEFILCKWGKGGNKVNSNQYIGCACLVW